MGCREDGALEILLDIEYWHRRNYAEVEWRPVLPTVGTLKYPDVGPSQQRIPRTIVTVNQQPQYRNIGNRSGRRRYKIPGIAVFPEPMRARINTHENMTDARRRAESRKREIHDGGIERIHRQPGRLRLARVEWEIDGQVVPRAAVRMRPIDLQVSLRGLKDLEAGRGIGFEGLGR